MPRGVCGWLRHTCTSRSGPCRGRDDEVTQAEGWMPDVRRAACWCPCLGPLESTLAPGSHGLVGASGQRTHQCRVHVPPKPHQASATVQSHTGRKKGCLGGIECIYHKAYRQTTCDALVCEPSCAVHLSSLGFARTEGGLDELVGPSTQHPNLWSIPSDTTVSLDSHARHFPPTRKWRATGTHVPPLVLHVLPHAHQRLHIASTTKRE
jgi:hypothetical protein